MKDGNNNKALCIFNGMLFVIVMASLWITHTDRMRFLDVLENIETRFADKVDNIGFKVDKMDFKIDKLSNDVNHIIVPKIK